MAKTLRIRATSKSQKFPTMDYEELFDLSAGENGIIIYPANDDILIPWDADIDVKDSNLILRGTASPGDPGAYCEVRIELQMVDRYLQMTIEPKDDESESRIREIMSENNWVIS